MTLARHDFVALVTLPPVPAPPAHLRAAVVDAFREFNDKVRDFHSRAIVWRAQISEHKTKLERYLKEAVSARDAATLAVLREMVLPNIVQQIDTALGVVRDRLDVDKETLDKLSTINALVPAIGRAARRSVRRYREVVAEQYNALVNLYYGFLALQGEFDPNAEGGPSFDNADDLIASLRAKRAS